MAQTLGEAPAASPMTSLFGRGTSILRRLLRVLLLGINILGLVALIGFAATEQIDDRLDFTPPVRIEGGLASVDMTVALIEREVERHAWVANEPFFMPGHYLTNMQAFQQGMIYGLSRFTYELADSLGRARGATSVDPDLDRAAGLLRFPGNVWIFDFEKTWTPVITSEEQYLSAARALQSYNERLAAGEANFNPRIDNLLAALSRIEADISSKSNVLVEHVERTAAGLPNPMPSAEVFFTTKGRMYAYAMVLEALGQDFEEVIQQIGLGIVWPRLISSLKNAAAMRPFIITDSRPGSMFVPSHVAEMGFFTLRAKTQLRDVMQVLRGGEG